MSEWISVEDETPSVGSVVVFLFIDGPKTKYKIDCVTQYMFECLSLNEYDPRWDCVTHWMPLPEPPHA